MRKRLDQITRERVTKGASGVENEGKTVKSKSETLTKAASGMEEEKQKIH